MALNRWTSSCPCHDELSLCAFACRPTLCSRSPALSTCRAFWPFKATLSTLSVKTQEVQLISRWPAPRTSWVASWWILASLITSQVGAGCQRHNLSFQYTLSPRDGIWLNAIPEEFFEFDSVYWLSTSARDADILKYKKHPDLRH